jgi:cytochrome c peroxidase
MKKSSLIISFFALLLAFQACKKDPPITEPPNPVDPDSLYVGKPYAFPAALIPQRYRRIISPANNPMTEEGVLLGRMLLYDPVISADSNLSCASCHKLSKGFGDDRKFSVKSNGALTTRHSPTLINMGMNKFFFADGRATTVEMSVEDAAKDEQHFLFTKTFDRIKNQERYTYLFKKAFGRPGDVTEDKIYKAIAQFLRSVISIDSKFDKSQRGQATLTADEQAGLLMFNNEVADCFHCHQDGPFFTFTSQANIFSNNGLDSVANINDFLDKGRGAVTGISFDNGKFKVPTLRNIEISGPFMHDARFNTLEQVIDFYSDSIKMSPTIDPLMTHSRTGGNRLNATQKAQLLAFLKTLTDETFLNNSNYKNPF